MFSPEDWLKTINHTANANFQMNNNNAKISQSRSLQSKA